MIQVEIVQPLESPGPQEPGLLDLCQMASSHVPYFIRNIANIPPPQSPTFLFQARATRISGVEQSEVKRLENYFLKVGMFHFNEALKLSKRARIRTRNITYRRQARSNRVMRSKARSKARIKTLKILTNRVTRCKAKARLKKLEIEFSNTLHKGVR